MQQEGSWILAFEHHYRAVLPQLRKKGIHYSVHQIFDGVAQVQFTRRLPCSPYTLDSSGVLHDDQQQPLSAEQLLRQLTPPKGPATSTPLLLGLLLSGLLLLTVYVVMGGLVFPLLPGSGSPLFWGLGSAGLLLAGLSLLKLLN